MNAVRQWLAMARMSFTTGPILARYEAKFRLERFERHRGQGSFDVWNHQQVFVDEMAHILGFGDIELQQKVVFAAGGIKLRVNLAQGDLFGDLVGGAGFAADLDENAGGHVPGLLT
jgi:hypothetical protein